MNNMTKIEDDNELTEAELIDRIADSLDMEELWKQAKEPFDIKLPEKPPEDVELLEGPPVRPKARQRRVTAGTSLRTTNGHTRPELSGGRAREHSRNQIQKEARQEVNDRNGLITFKDRSATCMIVAWSPEARRSSARIRAMTSWIENGFGR